MKQKLIILTTAITRGNLHLESIGLFYKKHKYITNIYDIIHIINIDNPIKLKEQYKPEYTLNLFNKIIPENIIKIININKDINPTFSKAYKNVINVIHEKQLLDDNTLIWWLEDDWKLIKYYNILPILNILSKIDNSAVNLTNNTPLISFRGGPIMSKNFFLNYFDISKKLDDNKDPEYKVGKYLRFNEIEYDKNIYIICIYIIDLIDNNEHIIDMNPSCCWYYKNKFKQTKFSNNRGIKYILGILNSIDSDIIYYKKNDNYNNLKIDLNDYLNIEKINLENFNLILENSMINYINIVPHIFQDIGRNFNSEHNIIK